MNTKKLLEAQKILDERILLEHIPENAEDYESRKSQKILANIVEVVEFINETRCFKYWSNKAPDKEKMLEEFVDGLHFFLGIAIDNGWQDSIHLVAESLVEIPYKVTKLERHFIDIVYHLAQLERSKSDKHTHFHSAWLIYLGVGVYGLGFKLSEIEAAYFTKNQINHTRQDEGY